MVDLGDPLEQAVDPQQLRVGDIVARVGERYCRGCEPFYASGFGNMWTVVGTSGDVVTLEHSSGDMLELPSHRRSRAICGLRWNEWQGYRKWPMRTLTDSEWLACRQVTVGDGRWYDAVAEAAACPGRAASISGGRQSVGKLTIHFASRGDALMYNLSQWGDWERSYWPDEFARKQQAAIAAMSEEPREPVSYAQWHEVQMEDGSWSRVQL